MKLGFLHLTILATLSFSFSCFAATTVECQEPGGGMAGMDMSHGMDMDMFMMTIRLTFPEGPGSTPSALEEINSLMGETGYEVTWRGINPHFLRTGEWPRGTYLGIQPITGDDPRSTYTFVLTVLGMKKVGTKPEPYPYTGTYSYFKDDSIATEAVECRIRK